MNIEYVVRCGGKFDNSKQMHEKKTKERRDKGTEREREMHKLMNSINYKYV